MQKKVKNKDGTSIRHESATDEAVQLLSDRLRLRSGRAMN